MKPAERQEIKDWGQWVEQFLGDATDDPNQTPIERAARIKRLEADPEAWFCYYFEKYCSAPAAPFHKSATKRLLANERWYEVRAWSRELAKSGRSMFEILYLALTGQTRNVLLVSNSSENADRLLLPFLLSFEHNKRIIADYGEQRTDGSWTASEFVARCGCAFRALGSGQSPRGTRNEEVRPDFILIDDIDTDEECRNPDRIAAKWRWVEEALFGTVSVSGKQRILFNGNVIAKDCCVVRAMEKADRVDIINLRMVNVKKPDPHNDYKYGTSVWPEKNSEADIDYLLSKRSLSAVLKEYFNCPVAEGDVFKEVVFGAVPKLEKFPYVVAYADPATSNKDKKGASTKALVLVGQLDGRFYVIRAWVDGCSNATFIDWFYELRDFVGGRTQVYYIVENNSLQDPFFEQVFKPLFAAKGKELGHLSVSGDARKKPDKFARIEGNLEPLSRNGQLIHNATEQSNPHMVRLKDQYLVVSPRLPVPVDGVDAVEGAVWILNNKMTQSNASALFIPRKTNPKRY